MIRQDLTQHGNDARAWGLPAVIVSAVLVLTLTLLLLQGVMAYRELRAVGRAQADDTLWVVLSFDADMERLSAILAMGLIEDTDGAQALEHIRLPFESYRNRLVLLRSHMTQLYPTTVPDKDPRPLLADLSALALDFDSKLASGALSRPGERQVMARRLAQIMPQVNAFSMGAMTHMAQKLMASQRATERRLILILVLVGALAVEVAVIVLLLRPARRRHPLQAIVVDGGADQQVTEDEAIAGAASDKPASLHLEPQSHHEAFVHLLEVLDRARLRAIYAALHQDLDQLLLAQSEAGHDQALRHQIHQCGGSAAMLGFTGLHRACYDLERALAGQVEALSPVAEWQSFAQNVIAVQPALQDFIAALQPGAARYGLSA